MSKVSSKRSRKSKLSGRSYEIEENMPDFQKSSTNNANRTSNPKVPNTSTTQTYDDFEALIDSQSKPKEVDAPKLEFSVTVAVEEFDEDSSDLIIIETNEPSPIQIISSDSETNDTVEEKHSKSVVSVEDKEYVIELPGNLHRELILDRNDILNVTNDILKNPDNIAEKILGIEVRNCIGQYRISFEDKFEAKIQTAFLKWFDWQKSIEMKFRSSPLCYKCYICKKSWWHLHDFREHLKGHDDFNLDLQEYTVHEANIIAYLNVDSIVDTDFETEGDCPKCGYEFDAHKSYTRKNSTYICKITNCKRIFYTCFALKTHEYMFHTSADFTGEILEAGKRVFCRVCSFVFYTQKSYLSHVNLVHTVRSDLVVPVRLKKCPLCDGKITLGTYHICTERKNKVQCKCYRSFQNGRQFRAHMARQNGVHKCRICNELLPRRCVEVEHMMKHTDKFVIVKKCLLCEDFTVFLDHQTAFDHISTHLNMLYEGSNYKYISKILIPKSCLLQHLEPKIEVKEEPNEVILAPELKIEQDIIDDFETDEVENKVPIKEEIEIHEDFESEHIKQELVRKTEADSDISRIFGVKIEASDIEMKPEMQVDEESEYEDDIIKLDFNFLDSMQESVEYSTQDCILKVENTTEGTQKAEEDMRGDEEDEQDDEEDIQEDDDMQEGNMNRKRNKIPKIYTCRRCGFDATHREYRAHIKSHCDEKVYERKIYTCTKCSHSFQKFNKFIDHFTTHNLRPLSCPECFKSFKSYKTIELHIGAHIRMTYVTVQIESGRKEANFHYKCRLCEEFIDKIDFFQHWVGHLTFIEKKEDRAKDTDDLDSNRINKEMLNELLERLVSPEPVNLRRGCPICLRHFERKNDYKRHLVEHLLSHAYSQHYLYKHLQCQICEKGFNKSDDYKKHMRDHGDLRDYRCEICDKFFSDSSNYSKHIKLHNKNAYTCDICKKKFQAKFSLEKHIVIHNTQKPIFCSPCNKTFFLESAYKKHYRVVHEKAGQTYSCKICKSRFRSLKDKWDHLWHVHKVRSQKADCPKCSKSFRKFIDLKMHMKIEHSVYLKNTKAIRRPKLLSTEGVKQKKVFKRVYI